MSEFQTSVSDVGNGVVNLRGYSLEEVMTELSYTQGVYLTIFGRLPEQAEIPVLDAVLNSLLDHGFVASTITAARYVASGNPQLVPAVAGGLLACGGNTVSPQHSFEMLELAEQIRETDGLGFADAARAVVARYRADKRRLPGLGHPTHKESDFRADVLFTIAAKNGVAGAGIEQFTHIHRAFVEHGGRHLPINVDGALAALGKDLGWTAQQVVALALLSVLPGVIGHVIEEIDGGRPLRHITNGTYTGPALRPLAD